MEIRTRAGMALLCMLMCWTISDAKEMLKSLQYEALPCVIVARTLRVGECLTWDGVRKFTPIHFWVPLDCKCGSGTLSIPLCVRNYCLQMITGVRGGGWGKVVLMMVKEGSFFLLYFKGLDSVSIHFPRLSVSRRNTAELTCVAFSTAPVWVSECAFCALLRFTGSTGPDACCLFPHIERCRRHVWRFLVLCFVLFEMLKMTFGMAPPSAHPLNSHTHTSAHPLLLRAPTLIGIRLPLGPSGRKQSRNLQKGRKNFVWFVFGVWVCNSSDLSASYFIPLIQTPFVLYHANTKSLLI